MSVSTIGIGIDSSAAVVAVDDVRASMKALKADFEAAEKRAQEFNATVASMRRAAFDEMSDSLRRVADEAKGATSEVHRLQRALTGGQPKLITDARAQTAALIADLRAVALAANATDAELARVADQMSRVVREGGRLQAAQSRPSQLSGSSPAQLRIAGPSQIIDVTPINASTSAFARLQAIGQSALASIASYARGAQTGLSSLASTAGQATVSAFNAMASMARGAFSAIGSLASGVASAGLSVLGGAARLAGTALYGITLGTVMAATGMWSLGAAGVRALGGWGGMFSTVKGWLGSLTNGIMRAITSVSTLSLGVVGLGGLSLGFLLKSAIETADAFTLMERKLMGLSGGSFATFSRLSGAINDIAVATRSGIGDTADQFNRMHLTLSNLGNSVETTAALTKGLSAELKLSGASAEESKRAMIQLSQWIGKGKADLTDLKSIREQAPGLMAQIELAAGRSMAKIAEVFKKGGAESQALTSQIFTYLANGADQAVEKLKNMPRTFEESVTGVKNAWFNAVGAMQQRSNFMEPLNTAADRLASIISSESFIRGFSEALRYATDTAAWLLEWATSGENIERTFSAAALHFANIGGYVKAAAKDLKEWVLPDAFGGFFGGGPSKNMETLAASIRKTADEQFRLNEAIRAAEGFYGSENTGVGGVKANAVGANGNRPGSTAPRGNFNVRTPMPAASKSSGGGGGRDIGASMQERIAALRQENELIQAQLTGDATLIRNAQMKLEMEKAITDEMRQKKPLLALEIMAEIDLKQRLQERLKVFQEWKAIGEQWTQSLWSNFEKVGAGTMKFKDALKQSLAELIKMVAQALILKPLMNSIGNGFGNIGSSMFGGGGGGGIGSFITSLFSANGNVFGSSGHMTAYANGGAFAQGVQMFANGGVVSSATAFGYGGGKLGVMGEAGPEAIMPLTRMPGGKLGVQAKGGSGGGVSNVISNTFHVGGSIDEKIKTEMVYEIEARIAAATPGITKTAVARVRREHTDNPSYLKR